MIASIHKLYHSCSRMRREVAAVTITLLACGLIPIQAMSSEGNFKPVIITGGQELVIRGADRLKWKGLISVYDFALYLPQEVPSSEVFRGQNQ